MTRLSAKTRDELTGEQRDEYDDLARTRTPRDGKFGGPRDAWLLSPELSQLLRSIGAMVRERTTLDRGLVSWQSRSRHATGRPTSRGPRTRRAPSSMGSHPRYWTPSSRGRRPNFAPVQQVLLYDICMSLNRERALPEPLYKSAVSAFGEQGLVEIIGVIGFYTLVSMTLNAFDVPVAPGVEAPFAR